MSLLAHGVIAIALLGVQEGKGDPNAKQDASLEDQVQVLLAVRCETEQRDFSKGLVAWLSVRAAAEKAGNKALINKADLGCARCFIALGKNDDAKAALKRVLAADPKNGESLELLQKLQRGGQGDDEVKEIVRQLADIALSLTTEQEDGRIKSARSDLVRMSDVAVPQLADLLRDNRVGVVDGAAKMLADMTTSCSFEALATALNDPRCRYPRILVGHVVGNGSELVLPVLATMLTRTEPELRRMASERLRGSLFGLAEEQQLDVAKRLLADSQEPVRYDAAYASFTAPVVKLLVPTFQQFVESKDEASLRLVIAFLEQNYEKLPSEVVTRWTAELAHSPIASIRRILLDREFDHDGKQERDPRQRTAAVMRYLTDDDGAVFSAGAMRLEGMGELRTADAVAAARASITVAMRHALELSGVSLANRYAVLTRLPLEALESDELFRLYVQLADHPADADAEWRANVRDLFARSLLWRPEEFERDRFAAARLAAIPDAPGRRVWFANAVQKFRQEPPPKLYETACAAAAVDDAELRVVAYRYLATRGATVDRLPHAAEDLAAADAVAQLAIVQSIRGGSAPELIAPLRALVAKSSGDLHDAALSALAYVGGAQAADELLMVLKATPKNGTFKYLRQLEQAIGAERLAAELVAVAKTHGTSDQVVWWMKYDNSMCVSGECVTAFVHQLPPELVGFSVFTYILDVVAPDVVARLVCQQLHEGKGYALEQAARLAGRYHIEAAWSDLVMLLDTGAGQTREEAIDALKSIKEFRDLKRSFAADDSDARRAAFDKAVAMTRSKNAEQRVGAAIALAATGDVAAISPLLDLLGDGDESVKTAAMKALEKLADRAVVMPVDGSKAGADKSGDKSGDGEKGKKKAGN